MTRETGSVLAIRQLIVDGKHVLVTVGTPRPGLSTDGRHFFCHVDIEGLTPAPIRLRASARTPARTVALGLRETVRRLRIGLAEFLSDALIGLTPHPDPAPESDRDAIRTERMRAPVPVTVGAELADRGPLS